MVTVCLVTCVILGLFIGFLWGYNVAYRRFIIISSPMLDVIEMMLLERLKNNVDDDELRPAEGEETENKRD